MKEKYDAIVIGSGPNGYAAAIYLADKGYSVLLAESRSTTGGGMRTEELTIPGFYHDVCSTMHPLAVASPFFNKLPLGKNSLEWIYPPVFLAHPFDQGPAAILAKSVIETADQLNEDRDKYINIMQPMTDDWSKLSSDILGPLSIPQYPFAFIRFGIKAIRSNDSFIKKFQSYKTKALFTGLAAHGIVPTSNIFTAAVGLILALAAHAKGWPYARGGSKCITSALDSLLKSKGGDVVTDYHVSNLKELPEARVILFNTSPQMMMKICSNKFSDSYKNALRKFKYGPAAFKVDFALSEPVPFKDEFCRKAGFIHMGGMHTEIIDSERRVFNGIKTDNPFVLFAQPTLFDPSRAPYGRHIAYAYCHAPNNSTDNLSDAIISQIERFAPGFRDIIISQSEISPVGFESYNPNYLGGDINGGMQSWDQLFTRPVKKLNPYKTPVKGIYICSSSTPPGGGVHGMCGYYGAVTAEKYLRGR